MIVNYSHKFKAKQRSLILYTNISKKNLDDLDDTHLTLILPI